MEAHDPEVTADASKIDSLQLLENRIVEIVEQLRRAREFQQQAEQEADRLRGRLERQERELAQLRASAGSAEGQRGEVRRRIESLLESVEKLS